jgi:hypothetical protein
MKNNRRAEGRGIWSRGGTDVLRGRIRIKGGGIRK